MYQSGASAELSRPLIIMITSVSKNDLMGHAFENTGC